MRIIDAIWESRNLGLSVAEVVITADDCIEQFVSIQEDLEKKYDYICLKTSTNIPGFLFSLGGYGYTFVETQIKMKHDSKNAVISPTVLGLYREYKSRIHVSKIESDEDFRILMGKIQDQCMFVTDRIYLDDKFEKSRAGYRYACWCRDLREQGGLFLKVSVDGADVSFASYIQNSPSTYTSPLGGTFRDRDEYSFLSPIITCCLFDYLSSIGCKTVRTAVSSNNKTILKFHLSTGCVITDLQYVYVKHIAKTMKER